MSRDDVLEELAIELLDRLPKNVISRGVGALTEVALPGPIQAIVNEAFARLADIDTEEAEQPPRSYRTLNAFFTRRLRPSARPIEAQDRRTVVSPVDGTLSTFGSVDDGRLLQAKGRTYTLVDLLDSGAHAREFTGGAYATIYLSPTDYHRIHSPVRGTIREISYIPGHLFPVFPLAVRNVDRLFAINERLISFIDVDGGGRVAVVKVGATCVGRIRLSYRDWETNGNHRRRRVERLEDPHEVEHGEEIGLFNPGSTVILLFSDPSFRLSSHFQQGDPLAMGETLGGWG